MLDFNNLNYFPSFFDWYSTPNNTYNVYDYDIKGVEAVQSKSKSLSNTVESDKKLELSTKKNVTFNIENTNLLKNLSPDSDRSTFSKYFYWDTPKEADKQLEMSIPAVNENAIEPLHFDPEVLNTDGASMNSKKSYRSYLKRFAGYVHDIFTVPTIQDHNNSDKITLPESFEQPLPMLNESPIRPLSFDSDEELMENPKGKLKVNVSVDDLFNTNQSIVKLDKQISNFNAQSIDFQHKMNELGKEISQFTSEKNELKQKVSSKNYTQWDLAKLNSIKTKLTFLENAQSQLLSEFNVNKNELTKLEAQKSTLVERSLQFKKQLGDIAITPTA